MGLPSPPRAALVKTSLSGSDDLVINARHWIDGAIGAAHVEAEDATRP
jgi:hypothetical protein